MLWLAVDLVPQPQRAALGAAIRDLQQITGSRQSAVRVWDEELRLKR